MSLNIIFFTKTFTRRGINYPVSSVGGIARTRQGINSLANSASPLKWTGRLVLSPLVGAGLANIFMFPTDRITTKPAPTLAISQRFESLAGCDRCHLLCNFPANSHTPPKKLAG